jgi:hypothetical protein
LFFLFVCLISIFHPTSQSCLSFLISFCHLRKGCRETLYMQAVLLDSVCVHNSQDQFLFNCKITICYHYLCIYKTVSRLFSLKNTRDVNGRFELIGWFSTLIHGT